jgi:hypothetical protein
MRLKVTRIGAGVIAGAMMLASFFMGVRHAEGAPFNCKNCVCKPMICWAGNNSTTADGVATYSPDNGGTYTPVNTARVAGAVGGCEAGSPTNNTTDVYPVLYFSVNQTCSGGGATEFEYSHNDNCTYAGGNSLKQKTCVQQ